MLRVADSGAVKLRPGMSVAPKIDGLAVHHLCVCWDLAGLPRALGAGDNCASRQSLMCYALCLQVAVADAFERLSVCNCCTSCWRLATGEKVGDWHMIEQPH
jgi:hypothetical protein